MYRLRYGGLYIRLDSSQKHRHYLVMHTGNSLKLEIWKDAETVEELEVI